MSKKVHLRSLLFDMDGVLVDVSHSYRRAIEETVGHFTGRQLVPGTIQRYKNQGGFNDDWKLTHAVITDTSMNVSFSRVVEEFQRRYRGENWNGFIAEEPALVRSRTLEKLAGRDGCIMGVVTGRPEAEAEWTLDRFGWKKYFPLVVAKEKQEGREKPDPFPLQHALTILAAAGCNLQPDEVVYVGDTVDDMRAARSAGMWAVGMVPPYIDDADQDQVLYNAGAHVVLHDSNDLPELFDSFGERISAEAIQR